MANITISKLHAQAFEVAVDARASTIHRVTVDPEYAQRLSQGRFETEELIRRSFEFLLERESNTSILRSFDLAVIARYFPEYEKSMTN